VDDGIRIGELADRVGVNPKLRLVDTGTARMLIVLTLPLGVAGAIVSARAPLLTWMQ